MRSMRLYRVFLVNSNQFQISTVKRVRRRANSPDVIRERRIIGKSCREAKLFCLIREIVLSFELKRETY